jgi:hypothetical protein
MNKFYTHILQKYCLINNIFINTGGFKGHNKIERSDSYYRLYLTESDDFIILYAGYCDHPNLKYVHIKESKFIKLLFRLDKNLKKYAK